MPIYYIKGVLMILNRTPLYFNIIISLQRPINLFLLVITERIHSRLWFFKGLVKVKTPSGLSYPVNVKFMVHISCRYHANLIPYSPFLPQKTPFSLRDVKICQYVSQQEKIPTVLVAVTVPRLQVIHFFRIHDFILLNWI